MRSKKNQKKMQDAGSFDLGLKVKITLKSEIKNPQSAIEEP
jgi:hypothetical protein